MRNETNSPGSGIDLFHTAKCAPENTADRIESLSCFRKTVDLNESQTLRRYVQADAAASVAATFVKLHKVGGSSMASLLAIRCVELTGWMSPNGSATASRVRQLTGQVKVS